MGAFSLGHGSTFSDPSPVTCSVSADVNRPLTQRANSREISDRFDQNANAQLFPGQGEAVEDRTKGGVITGEIFGVN